MTNLNGTITITHEELAKVLVSTLLAHTAHQNNQTGINIEKDTLHEMVEDTIDAIETGLVEDLLRTIENPQKVENE